MAKKNIVTGTIAGLLLIPGFVLAQETSSPHTITGNVGFFSDYSFRGLTQTLEEPAIQGGFDYAHASGLYLGTWGSNVSQYLFLDGNMEWDFYGGWTKAFGDFGVNVGALYYYYPGAEIVPGESYDTLELMIGGSWKWISAKLFYSATDFFGQNATTFPANFSDDSKGSIYLDLTATYPVSDALSLSAHVGQQTVEGTAPGLDGDYMDYKIGVNYLWQGFNFGVAYKDTNAEESFYVPITKAVTGDTVFIGDSAVIASVQKTF